MRWPGLNCQIVATAGAITITNVIRNATVFAFHADQSYVIRMALNMLIAVHRICTGQTASFGLVDGSLSIRNEPVCTQREQLGPRKSACGKFFR